jgi:hypothetical protein
MVNEVTDPIKKKLQLLQQGGIDLQMVYKNLPESPAQISPIYERSNR